LLTSEANSQSGVTFGISLDQGFSILSNKGQQIVDLFSEVDTSPTVGRAEGMWYSNSLTLVGP